MSRKSVVSTDIDDAGVRGVYSIRNRINGREYIGMTTTSFLRRARMHWTRLRFNKHKNKNLQQEWNTYGEAAFEFIVIERTQTPWDRERECIQQRRDSQIPPYNIYFW